MSWKEQSKLFPRGWMLTQPAPDTIGAALPITAFSDLVPSSVPFWEGARHSAL